MSVGIVLLIHNAFDRAEEVIRHYVASGCPVVVHVDANVPDETFKAFTGALSDLEEVRFSARRVCEWGTWGIVAATLDACGVLLRLRHDISHVYLASGSCLPLRPIRELAAYLEGRPETDFIESTTTADVPWTVGGLDKERFILRFPFSWKRQRFLFDRYVEFQRRWKIRRKIPEGITPHMGSQWWCLTRQTLEAILEDPRRPEFDRYFRRVWIPDESYFQTLARRHSPKIESRSLTLSKFDFQGKPHIFYDDHLQLLRRSDCFVARKIWPHAHRLYQAFLDPAEQAMNGTEPNPGKIDRIFAKAVDRRTLGRPGLYMQSRFPHPGWENGYTAFPYSVFEGFTELFEGFEPWLAKTTGARVHGHLFSWRGAEFDTREETFVGAMSSSVKMRDYNAQRFLTNLIWNTRGERQCFQFGPMDSQYAHWELAKDPNAQISVVTGAWAVPLFQTGGDFAWLRKEAASLQRFEAEHLAALRSPHANARIRIWSMAEFLEGPHDALKSVLQEFPGWSSEALTDLPPIVSLDGFGQFLQNLKNEGMDPYLMGDFAVEGAMPRPEAPPARKRYRISS